jgi:hypothetical protein
MEIIGMNRVMHVCGQQTNNVTVNTGDVEMSDTAPKRPLQWSNVELQQLATRTREQRILIRKAIKELAPKDGMLFPMVKIRFSDPTNDTKLPFPFVGLVPERFQISDDGWFYTGREKFAELLDKVDALCGDIQHSSLTLYGTRGYGKSHLLAALVCYLAAGEEKVVYIPDCGELVEGSVRYMIAAMLFAWADDMEVQGTIMTLNTRDDISEFFRAHPKAMFVVDQLNALERKSRDNKAIANKKAVVHSWLYDLKADYKTKSILSSSANNHSILNETSSQSSNKTMYVYGGLTPVSL